MTEPVITLRTAIADDIGAVDRLLSQSYGKLLKHSYPPSVQVLALPIISRANPVLLTSGTYYLAEDAEGTILGAGGWTRSARGFAVADIRHVATHHRHLRQGIARRVMMAIFAEARISGVTRLDCLATRTAVPFYEAMGFEIEADVTVGLRPGIDFPAIRMGRGL